MGLLRTLLAPYLAFRADLARAEQAPPTSGLAERANAVAFLQAGSGARVRSMEAKARDVVSVLDFGATGDGVTDDTAAFDAAIATGRTVIVPYTDAGYAVSNIRVVDNMQVVGEKAGMALAPTLIVAAPNAAAFRHDATENVFHCVFENLACRAAPGVTGAAFYTQRTQSHYAAYFTFRQIETYADLRTGYVGLFIFALWDRCRDGYLGRGSDRAHVAIQALAGEYGQTNRQNVNCIRDSMFFNAFGGDGAISASYGSLWSIDNSNFESLRTRAAAVYDLQQLRFSNCWFEHITGPAIVHAGVFAGTPAASTVTFDTCNFVLTGTTPHLVTIADQGSATFRSSHFNLIPSTTRLSDAPRRVDIDQSNVLVGGPGLATFGTGICGPFPIAVGRAFVDVGRLHGTGGLFTIVGYNPVGGTPCAWSRRIMGSTVTPLGIDSDAGSLGAVFRVDGSFLQMKVTTGSALVTVT